METNKIWEKRLNFLTLLPVILPLIKPVLKNIVGDSGAKQLVDLLDSPEINSAIGSIASNVQFRSGNDRIIELLINKIPGSPLADSEKLEKMQIEIDNLKDMVLNLINSKEK